MQTDRRDDQLFLKEKTFLIVMMKVLIFLPLLLMQHKCLLHMKEVDRDDVHAIRNDHEEGIWEN